MEFKYPLIFVNISNGIIGRKRRFISSFIIKLYYLYENPNLRTHELHINYTLCAQKAF